MNSVFWNHEHYADPTAAAAIENVMRKEEPGYSTQRSHPRQGWEDYANAIILEAVSDYRKARRRLRANRECQDAKKTIREVEEFFCSLWFSQLTTIDGEMLIKRLKEEETI